MEKWKSTCGRSDRYAGATALRALLALEPICARGGEDSETQNGFALFVSGGGTSRTCLCKWRQKETSTRFGDRERRGEESGGIGSGETGLGIRLQKNWVSR